eukprot:783124-Ditylum_brightwellii.AAC.1
MAELSLPQWQQTLFAVSFANGTPTPSTAAAIAAMPSPFCTIKCLLPPLVLSSLLPPDFGIYASARE